MKHTFEPIYNNQSSVLILGTFPSVKSREANFYYGHPQNRFWKVLAAILKVSVPETTKEKKQMLLAHGIAIWDVIASCEITGSSDASIRNVEVNDISRILKEAPIRAVFANGAKAEELYIKYTQPLTNIPIRRLPSTSPANAASSLDMLIEVWRGQIQPFLAIEA